MLWKGLLQSRVSIIYMTIPSSEITVNFSVFHNVLDNLIVRNNTLVGGQIVQYSSNGGAGGRIGQAVDGRFLLGANLRFNDLIKKSR